MSKLPIFTIADLLDAGVHFGHKTNRWNPKMASYIYGVKDGVHIIDLQKTAHMLRAALQVAFNVAQENGRILFVGTKIQASQVVAEYAEKCGQYYVNHRWLGGMLTNWGTVSKSIKTLEGLEAILNNAEESENYTKKELLEISRKRDKLLRSLGGIRNMGGRPDLLIIIDTNKEDLAILEAKKLGIPMIAIVDSNSDPDLVEHPVAGNDDAIRSIRLYCELFANAVIAGIKDSLVASGVDVGALAEGADLSRAVKKINKIKGKKVSKVTETGTKEEFGDFEKALAATEEEKSE
jgi:small subunit ribosomal protein S2